MAAVAASLLLGLAPPGGAPASAAAETPASSSATSSAASSAYFRGTYSYGPDRLHRYDVYRPLRTGASRRPAVFLIHGGGWAMGDKADRGMVERAQEYARAGFVAVSVNYRLVRSGVTLDDAVADVSSALSRVRARAAALGIDKNRIVAIGSSAGGHLGMALGTLGRGGTRLRAVVASAGMPALELQNTVARYRQGKAAWLVNRSSPKRGLSAQNWYAKVDPYVNAGPGDAPLLWLGSTKDTYVHPELPWKLAARLRASRVPAKVVVADDTAHGLLSAAYRHRDSAKLLTLRWVRNRANSTAMPVARTTLTVTATRTGGTARLALQASSSDLPDTAPYGADYTVSVARPGSSRYAQNRIGVMSSGRVTAVANRTTSTARVYGVTKGTRIKVSLRANGARTVRTVTLR